MRARRRSRSAPAPSCPNVTPIYNLRDDDYVYDGDQDPVKVERTDPYAAYNMQILEIYQRTQLL